MALVSNTKIRKLPIVAVYLHYFNMDNIQLIGLAAGVLTASSLLPQLIKTVKEKRQKIYQ